MLDGPGSRAPRKREFLSKRSFGVLASLVFLGPAATGAPARGPQAKPQTTSRQVAPRAAAQAQQMLRRGPDLVLSGFAVTGPLQAQGNYLTAPFQVTVRNAGTVKVPKPFYVTIQYADPVNPNWRGENNGDNCFQVTALLDPGQTYLLTARLKILGSGASNRTIKLRALADYDCGTDIPAPNGLVAESNENNNFSNEASISSGYLPGLTSVYPAVCVKGVDDGVVNGPTLGAEQDGHTVVVEGRSKKTAVTIKSWTNATVHFTVPDGAEVGPSWVYIAESGTLSRLSDPLSLTVAETRAEPWTDLLNSWALFSVLLSLRLHNWSGGSEPNNQSVLNIPSTSSSSGIEAIAINLPKVEFKTSVGHYRFLVNDINSETSGGMVLTKQGCTANQVRLNIAFESAGTELIGYYKVLGPAGVWRRAGAPDIEIDNGRLGILFSFYTTGAALNYTVNPTFEASVHAHNSAADSLMDTFISNWNDNVKAAIGSSVHDALMTAEIKSRITQSLMDIIRKRLSLPDDRRITKIEFTNAAIKITSY